MQTKSTMTKPHLHVNNCKKSINLLSFMTMVLCTKGILSTSVSKSPNMVVIILDDVGYGDITSFWNPHNEPPSTPFIDSLVTNGIKFTDFHSSASACTPSRGSLLTARMGRRTGLTNVIFPSSTGGLPLNETTFGETFKAAGYRTAMVGKWHVGENAPYNAIGRGFDMYYGVPYSADMGCMDQDGFNRFPDILCPLTWADFKDEGKPGCFICQMETANFFPAIPLFHNEKVIEQPVDMRNLSRRYVEVITGWIKNTNDRSPFLLYVGLALMHIPFFVMPEFSGKSSRGTHYGDALLEMDWAVENIVNAIREIGEEENTVIWIASDNGPGEQLCEYGGSPGPFNAEWQRNEGGGGSASKWSVWEGGHRVPALAYWPGRIEGGQVSDELVSMMDIYPTMATLAGIQMPGGRIYDGIDISNILFGKPLSTSERVLYFQNSEYHQDDINGIIDAVRVGPYKGVFKTGGTEDCQGVSGPDMYFDPPLIFNAKTDAGESTPLTEASKDYSTALAAIEQAMDNLNTTLAEGKMSTVDYSLNPYVAPCCNLFNVYCRC